MKQLENFKEKPGSNQVDLSKQSSEQLVDSRKESPESLFQKARERVGGWKKK